MTVRVRTDIWGEIPENTCMENITTRILQMDRVSGDAVITFEDKRTAVYPASFLYTLLPQVQELFDSDEDLDDDI